MAGMCGGIGAVKEANDEVKAIVTAVKADTEGKVGKQFGEFTAVTFTSQVVAGTNFFVKVHTGDDVYAHVRIFRPLPGQGDPTLHSVQHPKGKEDEIAYF